jgi:hypothetical protein
MMKKQALSIPLLMSLIFFFSQPAAAAPPADGAKPLETSCIRGTVWYRSPVDTSKVPYARAKVTAWRHGTREGLTEARTDSRGRYCIEVPQGTVVDLRVWGLEDFGGSSFICRGSADKIDLGTGGGKCGGDCVSVDIVTECTDQIPRRRRP